METKLNVSILESTPNGEELVSKAARLCYSNADIVDLGANLTEEQVAKFVENLMCMGHMSPVEHVSITFGVEGVSRTLTHQLVRHRIGSYSQQSQRYVKEIQFEYVVPPKIAANEKAKEIYLQEMENSQRAYDEVTKVLMADRLQERTEGLEKEELIEHEIYGIATGEEYMRVLQRISAGELQEYDEILAFARVRHGARVISDLEKICIEDARYMFPNAAETKIILTMNIRSLYNFFKLRSCRRAQWEIQELSNEMLRQAREVYPVLFKRAGPGCVTGKCPEGKMTCGRPFKRIN